MSRGIFKALQRKYIKEARDKVSKRENSKEALEIFDEIDASIRKVDDLEEKFLAVQDKLWSAYEGLQSGKVDIETAKAAAMESSQLTQELDQEFQRYE